MSEPKLPSWMNYSDYEDIMHYLRLFGEMKPYYLKAEDVFNTEQEVMKRKIDDGLRLIDVAKEMIWSYKYKERWHQLPKEKSMDESLLKEFTHKYQFEIQWNTGDEYWDNFPDYDEYEGTIEGLNDYLNSQLDKDEPRACFDKEAWRALMDGKTVYDETGARYSVKLKDKVDESLESAKKLLLENGYILERYDLDYDSVNSSFNEEKRLEKFGEYLYEVRELLVRKGFSRGKQADNYDELHDIAHRCCRLGKSIDDCAKEIILTIK